VYDQAAAAKEKTDVPPPSRVEVQFRVYMNIIVKDSEGALGGSAAR
jgi:hypothetical protein